MQNKEKDPECAEDKKNKKSLQRISKRTKQYVLY